MATVIRDIYLDNAQSNRRWRQFLAQAGIERFLESEVTSLDQTVGVFDDDRLVATGSIAGSIIKYMAVLPGAGVHGALFNQVFSELVSRLAARGIFHYFVFTKPGYVASFEHVGCTCLAQVDAGAVLEGGVPGIEAYLDRLPQEREDADVAAIVMNADPFTLGHRHLVERAASEHERVYVFVSRNDASLLTSDERLMLVRQGLADLGNVAVWSGGDYLVSFVTFPSYFLHASQNVVDYQTRLDATVFARWFVPRLSVRARYVGEEPFSPVTATYNAALRQVLEPQVCVQIVPRLEVVGIPVSASAVRRAIGGDERGDIATLVPRTTEDFIQQHWASLRSRIKKGIAAHERET